MSDTNMYWRASLLNSVGLAEVAVTSLTHLSKHSPSALTAS